jgi:trigger factor
MNVSLKTLAPQHGQLHISIEQGDYFPKVQEELKKIRKTAHIKGFRHGAVPESVVKKLYGPGIEAEVLNKMVNELIEKYQKENDTNFLGDLLPLPELSSPADGSVTNHEFFFEVGIAPVANVEDALAKIQLSKNKIILEDSVVEDELNHLKNQYGSLSEIKGPIERGDLIELEVAELLDGAAKQDGILSSFSLMVDDTLTDEVLVELTGKNVDELLRFNIRTVEKKSGRKKPSESIF